MQGDLGGGVWPGRASGTWGCDVSAWVVACIAGVVWDQVSANLVVVGLVGLLTYLTLRLT